jgi:predicted RNA-binding Zn ribbon-like protein
MSGEPIAVAFANTRSSPERDRIADVGLWRAWLELWPGLRTVGDAVGPAGLASLRALRDDVQTVLRAHATVARPDDDTLARLFRRADDAGAITLQWGVRGYDLAQGHGRPETVLAGVLARATLGGLVAGPALGACQGADCLKVFTMTRADRRWCDSAVCGNRARVKAHARRALT